MRFEILFLGKTKEPYLAAGVAEYAARLKRYVATDIKILKERKSNKKEPDKVHKARESDYLLQNAQGLYIVCLDRTGVMLDSLELAARVEHWQLKGLKKVTFIIGGPLGLSEEVLTKADLVLSLSAMTFTHEMTRLLLLEQLYRACTIKAGEKYHK